MNVCDPDADLTTLQKFVTNKTGVDLKLTRPQLCKAYTDIKNEQWVLPPMMLSKDRTWLVDKKSPLNAVEYQLLLKTSTKASKVKSLAKRIGAAIPEGRVSKQAMIESIYAKLKSMDILEPIQLAVTRKRATKIVKNANSVLNGPNSNNNANLPANNNRSSANNNAPVNNNNRPANNTPANNNRPANNTPANNNVPVNNNRSSANNNAPAPTNNNAVPNKKKGFFNTIFGPPKANVSAPVNVPKPNANSEIAKFEKQANNAKARIAVASNKREALKKARFAEKVVEGKKKERNALNNKLNTLPHIEKETVKTLVKQFDNGKSKDAIVKKAVSENKAIGVQKKALKEAVRNNKNLSVKEKIRVMEKIEKPRSNVTAIKAEVSAKTNADKKTNAKNKLEAVKTVKKLNLPKPVEKKMISEINNSDTKADVSRVIVDAKNEKKETKGMFNTIFGEPAKKPNAPKPVKVNEPAKKPNAKPAPAPKPNAKPAPKPNAKPAPKPNAKPAPKPNVKPNAPKPNVKPVPKPNVKPNAPKPKVNAPVPKPNVKPVPKPAPKPNVKPAPPAKKPNASTAKAMAMAKKREADDVALYTLRRAAKVSKNYIAKFAPGKSPTNINMSALKAKATKDRLVADLVFKASGKSKLFGGPKLVFIPNGVYEEKLKSARAALNSKQAANKNKANAKAASKKASANARKAVLNKRAANVAKGKENAKKAKANALDKKKLNDEHIDKLLKTVGGRRTPGRGGRFTRKNVLALAKTVGGNVKRVNIKMLRDMNARNLKAYENGASAKKARAKFEERLKSKGLSMLKRRSYMKRFDAGEPENSIIKSLNTKNEADKKIDEMAKRYGLPRKFILNVGKKLGKAPETLTLFELQHQKKNVKKMGAVKEFPGKTKAKDLSLNDAKKQIKAMMAAKKVSASSAFKRLSLKYHPNKGGSGKNFITLQKARDAVQAESKNDKPSKLRNDLLARVKRNVPRNTNFSQGRMKWEQAIKGAKTNTAIAALGKKMNQKLAHVQKVKSQKLPYREEARHLKNAMALNKKPLALPPPQAKKKNAPLSLVNKGVRQKLNSKHYDKLTKRERDAFFKRWMNKKNKTIWVEARKLQGARSKKAVAMPKKKPNASAAAKAFANAGKKRALAERMRKASKRSVAKNLTEMRKKNAISTKNFNKLKRQLMQKKTKGSRVLASAKKQKAVRAKYKKSRRRRK